MILGATGLSRLYITSGWGKSLAGVFGEYESALVVHKYVGFFMICGFIIHAIYLLTKIKPKTLIGPNSLLPRGKDITDFFGHIGWFLGLKELPRFDRWGYWEKFDYWAVFWGMVIIGVTGLILIFTVTVWSLALIVFPGIFLSLCKLSNYIAKKPVPDRTLVFKFTYILIPVGIFAWISFSLPAIMINYGYIISIISDPLGLGWDLFNLANVHFKPFLAEWIPLIQGVVLLTGLYLGLDRGQRSLREVITKKKYAFPCHDFPIPVCFALCQYPSKNIFVISKSYLIFSLPSPAYSKNLNMV